jgi:hypothetical protein
MAVEERADDNTDVAVQLFERALTKFTDEVCLSHSLSLSLTLCLSPHEQSIVPPLSCLGHVASWGRGCGGGIGNDGADGPGARRLPASMGQLPRRLWRVLSLAVRA